MIKIILRFMLIVATMFLVFGCGSGSSVTPPQQNTATVVFSASNSPLTTPVSGLQITAKMPTGANVRLKAGSANEIDVASLSSKLPTSSVAGSYSSVTREVTLLVIPTIPLPTDWGTAGSIGVFAEIKVDCQPGITKVNFTSINPDFPGFIASDGTTPGPTLLLTPSMDVLGL